MIKNILGHVKSNSAKKIISKLYDGACVNGRKKIRCFSGKRFFKNSRIKKNLQCFSQNSRKELDIVSHISKQTGYLSPFTTIKGELII